MKKINLLEWTQSTINRDISGFMPPADMRQSISQVKELPPFPATANRIVQLASDPLADAKKLAEIIELDLILATQVIRWASSALYGFRGKINSVQDAITKVLGFDFVLNLALSLAALAPLKSPIEGSIGTKFLWIQSLASTRLMTAIAQKMPAENRPQPQHIFLTGLMHNIGFLLLGHQFSGEYTYLRKLIETNQTLAINAIENFAFGFDHGQLGAWLMQTWSMPKPVLDVVFHHHNPNYRGQNHHLNLLVFLSDSLLGKIGIGDAINQLCPDSVFEQLLVKQTQCENLLDDLEQDVDGIKATVENLLS
jgi:HD-like signal output (HDOD) protein